MNAEWLTELRLRWRALLHRRRLERDLEEELRFHLETRAERQRSLGLESNAALHSARRSFGNPTLYKEQCRDMWTFRWMELLGQDLRYAVRTLRKSPGFTVVAVLTLALGIGANTAIFSVVNAVMLRPLPYPQPERLVELWGNVKRAQVERRGASYPDYSDWRAQSRSFESMAAFTSGNFTLTGVDEPERLSGEFVSQPYFDLLGIRAARGRVFRPEEDQAPQRDLVVTLSDGLWKRRFGGDLAIVGRNILLNGKSYSVIGVMPPGFRGLSDTADIWLPFMLSDSATGFARRSSRSFAALARLRPGVSLAQAQAEMNGISKRLEQAYPDSNEARGVELSPLLQELFGNLRRPLILLMVAVGFVLLIACTNVANLLLARSEARQREIAVRIALGAGRLRMLHQLITESCLLAFGGAAAGLLLAHFGIRGLMLASPVTFPSFIRPGLDPTVTLFTVGISCLAGLLMGLAPALHVRSGNLHETFQQASNRGTSNRGGRRFRGALVVAEVAFALLLLVGAGLLMRSLQQLAAIRPGFEPARVLTLQVSLPRLTAPPASATPALGAPADAKTVVTAAEVLREASRIPSVEAAALGSDAPLAGGESAAFFSAEGQAPMNAQNRPRAYIHSVTPGFFQALGVRFKAGRTFTQAEMQGEANVVIVSENIAKRFWPGQDATGKRLTPGGGAPWFTIVGVVNEMKYRGLPENPTADPDIFAPLSDRQRSFFLLLRTPLEPASLASSLRRILKQAEPGAVVFNVSTVNQLIATANANSRFTGWLMAIFAGTALLLAVIGIYGVMAYSVSRRTQEIGIRVALGAAKSQVVRMVVTSGMVLIGVGLVLGTAAAVALTRLIGTLLYGVEPTDFPTFTAAALTLALVALIACLVPALRACRIHPAAALRNE